SGAAQHHQRELPDAAVAPAHSGLLRTVDAVGELGFGPTSPIADGGVRPLRGEERFGEAAIGDLRASDLGDETADPPPRIRVGHRLRRHGSATLDLPGEPPGGAALARAEPAE